MLADCLPGRLSTAYHCLQIERKFSLPAARTTAASCAALPVQAVLCCCLQTQHSSGSIIHAGMMSAARQWLPSTQRIRGRSGGCPCYPAGVHVTSAASCGLLCHKHSQEAGASTSWSSTDTGQQSLAPALQQLPCVHSSCSSIVGLTARPRQCCQQSASTLTAASW